MKLQDIKKEVKMHPTPHPSVTLLVWKETAFPRSDLSLMIYRWAYSGIKM
jgi:hypothetical protein